MNIDSLSYDEQILISLYRQLIDADREKHMQFFEISLQNPIYGSKRSRTNLRLISNNGDRKLKNTQPEHPQPNLQLVKICSKGDIEKITFFET